MWNYTSRQDDKLNSKRDISRVSPIQHKLAEKLMKFSITLVVSKLLMKQYNLQKVKYNDDIAAESWKFRNDYTANGPKFQYKWNLKQKEWNEGMGCRYHWQNNFYYIMWLSITRRLCKFNNTNGLFLIMLTCILINNIHCVPN